MVKHHFKQLKIWQLGLEIAKSVYRLSLLLPSTEKYGLTQQIQRAAVSLPSNIAEGSGRGTDKEFNHFLNIAIGSSFELETQLLLVQDLFQNEEMKSTLAPILNQLSEWQAMTIGFKNKINSDKSEVRDSHEVYFSTF
jgi:four helix bundle protein